MSETTETIIIIVGVSLGWILIGLCTQMLIRIIEHKGVKEQPEAWFWCALLGPIATFVWILAEIFDN